MAKGGKPGKPKWIVSDWVDLEEPETVVTILSAIGWALAIYLYLFR